MLKVYVWLPTKKSAGHTSISFRSNYVSIRITEGAGVSDVNIQASHQGSFIGALKEDVTAEGGRQPQVITINEINTEKLAFFIANISNHIPQYQFSRYNNAHVVADCLTVACNSGSGAAGQYSKTAGGALGKGVWTSTDVLRYATELSLLA